MTAYAIAAALAVIVWAAGAMPVQARQQNQPQFRARTDLVQVDVVVLDRKGRPVRGLQASDFTVLDRLKPQPIQTFAEISHADTGGKPDARLPLDVRLDVADNAKSQRAIVLVIQNMNLRERQVPMVKEVAAHVVRALGPSASLALLFTSGHGSVELTEDRAILLGAIEGFSDIGAHGPEAFFRLLKSVEDAARHLRGDDTRRKAIIVIAPGLGADITGLYQVMRPRPTANPIYDKSGTQERSDIAFLAMLDALRRSNVTLYGIDARTRLESLEERSREGSGNEPALRMFDEKRPSRDALELTAEASGGFAVNGLTGLAAGLNRIVADLDNYYLLGFYAEDADRDRWSELEVRVNRPGVIVRHRNGYRGGVKPPKPKNTDPMVRLSEGVLPATDLRLRLFATPVALAPKSASLALLVDARDPAFEKTAVGHDRVTVTILAVDLKRKKVVKRIDRLTDVVGPDGAYRFPFTTQLPPGSYQLRASLASAASGKSGSVYLAIEVPVPPKRGIAIAGASLSLRGDGDGVVLDRVFVPSDVLQVSYWIARADPAAVVSTTIEARDSDGVVVLTSRPELPGDHSAPVRADVSLKSLPAGSYRLRMIARSSAGEAAREIGFAIKTQ